MFDVEIKTDHTLNGGSVEIKNDSAVDGLELKLESEIDDKVSETDKRRSAYLVCSFAHGRESCGWMMP